MFGSEPRLVISVLVMAPASPTLPSLVAGLTCDEVGDSKEVDNDTSSDTGFIMLLSARMSGSMSLGERLSSVEVCVWGRRARALAKELDCVHNDRHATRMRVLAERCIENLSGTRRKLDTVLIRVLRGV